MIPTIDELFYGNVTPHDDCLDTAAEQPLKSLTLRNIKDLNEVLTPEQRELFNKYLDNEAELTTMRELSAFKMGFALGMQLTVEGMTVGKSVTASCI